jgi:hypothetical protein
MTFLGDIEVVEGRSPSNTTTVLLRECLGNKKEAGGKDIAGFLEGLSIKPEAFFKEIDADWIGRPFIGQYVFSVVQSAGYKGTEDDLWLAVTGARAPYPVKGRGSPQHKPALTEPATALTSGRSKPRSRHSPTLSTPTLS